MKIFRTVTNAAVVCVYLVLPGCTILVGKYDIASYAIPINVKDGDRTQNDNFEIYKYKFLLSTIIVIFEKMCSKFINKITSHYLLGSWKY